MKLFIGILSSIIVLTGATLTILSLWDIYPISWVTILKAAITIAVVCTTILVMWLIKTIFFQKNPFIKNKGQHQN